MNGESHGDGNATHGCVTRGNRGYVTNDFESHDYVTPRLSSRHPV